MSKSLTVRVLLLTAATMVAGLSGAVSAATEIPFFSKELAKERGPTKAPFIVMYRSSAKVLTFVGADHVFTDHNSTIDSIRRAFMDTDPSMVIVEGVPTVLGRNPAPILQAVRRRGEPGADTYAKSEAIFAASLAMARNVPFIGGEPTLNEEIDGLVARGYVRDDVLFCVLLRSLGQARKSGAMPAGNSSAFNTRFEQESGAVARMTGTDARTEAQFVSDYLKIVGVDPISDTEMPSRADPGTATLVQRMSADNMRFRDQHLLATILRELAANNRILVVYGSSHWTTLSQALEDWLGKPASLISKARD
jgi:hypothetical protein